MKNFLSTLAFAGLIAAQFLSVVLVNTQRCEDTSPGTRNRIARAPACGSLAHSARKVFSLALGCLCDLLDGLQRNQQRAFPTRYVVGEPPSALSGQREYSLIVGVFRSASIGGGAVISDSELVFGSVYKAAAPAQEAAS